MKVSPHETHARDYCENVVKSHDEDRWLAAQYAADYQKRRLIALQALRCELKRIPFAVSEPALGEIRLQWWREALDEIRNGKSPRAHPVVEELAESGIVEEKFAPRLEEAIDSVARLLYAEGFSDGEDLIGWSAQLDGALDAVAVEVLGGDASVAEATRRAGGAFTAAREGHVLAPHNAGKMSEAIRKVIEETSAALNEAPGEAAPAILHLALTKTYLRRGRKPFPVTKRFRLFLAMALGRF